LKSEKEAILATPWVVIMSIVTFINVTNTFCQRSSLERCTKGASTKRSKVISTVIIPNPKTVIADKRSLQWNTTHHVDGEGEEVSVVV